MVTAQEDGADTLHDPHLLDRATRLGRALFSQDQDLLTEAVHRQRAGEEFAGVVYAHQRSVPFGMCIRDLELIARVYEPPELINRIIYLPLR